MEKLFSDISPIMDIEHDCILSKRGDISIVFRLRLPEIFTMYDDDFENLHQGFIKAIKVLPKESIFHKQDWFLKASYTEGKKQGPETFLGESSRRHFEGRPYLRHESYVILTKKPAGRRTASSSYSALLRAGLVPTEVLGKAGVAQMEDCGGQFQTILEAAGIGIERMKGEEIASSPRRMGLIERYYSLSENPEELVIKDIEFKPSLRVGDQFCQLYTLSDTENLPSMCGSRITYDKYSTDRSKFPIGFAASLGLLLNCNHIYNQYIFIDDPQLAIKKFESKRLRLQSLAAYSRENAIAGDAVNDFLNECVGDQKLPVDAHCNLLVWAASQQELQESKKLVTAGMAQIDATVKVETAGAAQIWFAGIPGNAAEFPMNDTFKTFAEVACCFLAVETNYRSDPPDQGIRFCDRIGAVPVYLDLFDRPRLAGTTSNMGMLIAGASGGGKSMTMNHIVRSLYDQDAHCVIVDIGGSYKGLCELVNGRYLSHEEKNPFSFNPFWLGSEKRLDTEKKETLKALLITLWKQENEDFNRAEYVALSNALEGYYSYLRKNPDTFACFNTFYEYLENVYVDVIKSQRIKERNFDIDNFLYVLRPFFGEGEFGYLLNATERLDLLQERFVVIELDNIAENPILFPVVTMTLMSLFISKIRKLAGVRKVLIIDEAWKALTKNGMASFAQYAWKTIRKFNGVPAVVSQEIDDLISSPIVKETIVANSDIKILMDMRKFANKFDKIQDTLGLSEKAKAILLSVNKNDREIFIDLGGKISRVFRNELSPEEYFAYTTEGRERVRVRELAEQYGSIEKGIVAMVSSKKNVG